MPPPQNSAWSEAEAQARIEAARRDGATSLDLEVFRPGEATEGSCPA